MGQVLSVSVAAYNVAETIKACLDSFVQSRHLESFEVLVINDGSKDNTSEIVAEYEKRYPKTVRLIDKKNGGHGSTINAAVNLAKGKYFKVVDGDDWVDTVEFDKFIEFLQRHDEDLILNDYMECFPTHKEQIDILRQYKIGYTYTFNDMDPQYYIPMHSTTIKLIKYKNINEKISENCFYVDTEFVAFVAMAANSVAFAPFCVYQYRIGEVGQSMSVDGKYKHIEDLMRVVERLIQLYHFTYEGKSNSVKSAYIFNIIRSRYKMIFQWTMHFTKSNKDYMLKQFDQEMQKNYPEVVANIHIGKYKFCRLNYGLFIKIDRTIKRI